MKFFNVLDERGRYVGLKVDLDTDGPQADTHTYSYLGARQVHEELGETEGLEKITEEERKE